MPSTNRRAWLLGTAVALLALGAFAGCGDDDDDESAGGEATTEAAAPTPTPLAITTSDAGSNRFSVEAPARIKGGLVELTFTNAGKAPHEAQLVRLEGNHTAEEAIKLITSDDEQAPTPEWLRAAGGAGTTGPGQTVKVTMNLPAGKYVMVDNESMEDGPSNAERGGMHEFEVTAGEEGDLPASTAKIVAATDEMADPENSFEISGLKVGKNRLLLDNKGGELHHAIMFPIMPGKTLADVEKFLASEGRPSGPPPLDFESGAGTAVTDGDTAQVSDLTIRKPGTYAVLCFLTDRDGKDKPHFARGMLEEVDVK